MADSWEKLRAKLNKAKSELVLREMMIEERRTAKRPTILLRIYGKFAKVRRAREVKELLK